ncbi:DUF58 domain-containing protein [Nonomuraea sp. NPDC050328]|uniref:DUF58 domain-containing protein n=1 Tax=Nonomuraea sp. NPDC050328 TaxID=3364361 RepID=UPI003798C069
MSGLWRPTRALRRALVLVAVAPLAALLLGRPGLLVLAAPFALGTVLALARRPAGPPEAALELAAASVPEGEHAEATVRLTVPTATPAGPSAEAAVVCLVTPRATSALEPAYGSRHHLVQVRPGRAVTVAFGYTATVWGAHEVGPVEVAVSASDGLLEHPPLRLPVQRVVALPDAGAFTSRAQLPHADGLSGAHRSRRPGEGGELAGVRRFQSGDRLRRIDWRTTLRTGETHVNATYSERDAEVLILVDVLHEGPLDTAVRAAAALAGHYTSRGDRVSIAEYGSLRHRLRPGTGRRHYLAALEWLAAVRVNGGAGDELGRRLLAPTLAGGRGLVFMLTPLLDERSADGLARLARSRRPLVAVDTLPDRPGTGVAERLWWLDRENLIGSLREAGVPVEPWRGSGSLDVVLRDVTRLEHTR